MKIEAKWTRKG